MSSVTHRSNSSLGSFLLMTASSLFVNIWNDKEHNVSTGRVFKRSWSLLYQLNSLKDNIAIKARINDCNFLSCNRFNVKSWPTLKATEEMWLRKKKTHQGIHIEMILCPRFNLLLVYLTWTTWHFASELFFVLFLCFDGNLICLCI